VHHNTNTHVRRRALRCGAACIAAAAVWVALRWSRRVLRATINKTSEQRAKLLRTAAEGARAASAGAPCQVLGSDTDEICAVEDSTVGAHRRTRSPFSDERTTFRLHLQQSTLASEFLFPKAAR